MAIAMLPLTHSLYINFLQFSIKQASLPTTLASRIRHRLPSSRGLNSEKSSAHSRRFYFVPSCSITNTDIQLEHAPIDDEAQEESSTNEPDCPVPILKLSSDVLEAHSFDLLTQGTYADSLLTALPVLTEEEQYVLAATPAHPAGLYAFYASCIAANLVEQMWNFAWPSAIALIHPSLLPVAVIGFFTKLAIIIGGPLVGKLMDHSPRMLAYNCLNIVQAAAQLLSAGMIIHAHSIHSASASSLLLRPWFIVLVLAGAIERLCGVAIGIANERDWVVLLAGVNRPIALAQANAVLNRIDLVCEITGASLFGVILSKFDPVTSLKFVASLMMGSLPVAIVFTWLTNKLSTGVLDRSKSYQTSCRTVNGEPKVHGDNIVDKGVEAIKLGWKEYLDLPVLPASLACVVLCFNVVLTPSSLMTAFLTQRGLNPSIVGGFSGLCAFMGIAATFVSANLVKHFGIIKAGACGLLFQAFLLCMSVIVYFSGSTSQRSPLLFFLFFIILSRLGHMSYDVVGAQILQTAIPSSKANLIGTTEVAVASLAESVMLVVAMVANDVSHFGLLAMLSLASVVGAAWMFCRWMLNPTDEQRSLFSFDSQF